MMMMPMVRHPPQRPATQSGTSTSGQQETKKPACLETTMSEQAVITGTHAEAANLQKEEDDKQLGQGKSSPNHSQCQEV
jgi:hypothetical protein